MTFTGWPTLADSANIEALTAAVEAYVGDAVSADGPTAYTPAVTNATATATGKFSRIGKLVHVEFFITFTGTATGTVYLSLPSTAAESSQIAIGKAVALDGGVTSTRRSVTVGRDSNPARVFFNVDSLATNAVVNSTVPWTWANTDTIAGSLTYIEA